MDKGSLHDVLRKEKEFKIKTLLDYSYQAAQGLMYLHNRGIIHGDFAARNLLLDTAPVQKALFNPTAGTNKNRPILGKSRR